MSTFEDDMMLSKRAATPLPTEELLTALMRALKLGTVWAQHQQTSELPQVKVKSHKKVFCQVNSIFASVHLSHFRVSPHW